MRRSEAIDCLGCYGRGSRDPMSDDLIEAERLDLSPSDQRTAKASLRARSASVRTSQGLTIIRPDRGRPPALGGVGISGAESDEATAQARS